VIFLIFHLNKLKSMFLNVFRNLFPDNIVEMAFRQHETRLAYVYKYNLTYDNGTTLIVSRLPEHFESILYFYFFPSGVWFTRE